jgi:ABC-type xylose transport system permease subunit
LGAALFVIGLMALNYLTNNFWPFDITRLDLVRATTEDRADVFTLLNAMNMEIMLAFLTAVFVTVTGLMLPLAYILNKRFGAYADRRFGVSQATPFWVVLRQAMGVGFWVSFCVWLQMNRALGLAVAFLVAAVLITFELLLQLRTRAASVSQIQSS